GPGGPAARGGRGGLAMRAVGLAFAREMWGRSRLMAAPALAYLLVLVLLVNGLPAGTFAPEGVAWLGLPLWGAGQYLLGVFSQVEHADLGARESAYPRRAFTLPLRARALVAWPMALGAAALALFWLAVAGLVLRRAGVPVPVLWPAAALAALLAWGQA